MSETTGSEDEASCKRVAQKRVVKCPRCDREVKNQELGKARIDGELSHVSCARDEIDEMGMDDFTNW